MNELGRKRLVEGSTTLWTDVSGTTPQNFDMTRNQLDEADPGDRCHLDSIHDDQCREKKSRPDTAVSKGGTLPRVKDIITISQMFSIRLEHSYIADSCNGHLGIRNKDT